VTLGRHGSLHGAAFADRGDKLVAASGHRLDKARLLRTVPERASCAVSVRRHRHWFPGSSRNGRNSLTRASFKATIACSAANGPQRTSTPFAHA
jgi:hypothetical protein